MKEEMKIKLSLLFTTLTMLTSNSKFQNKKIKIENENK